MELSVISPCLNEQDNLPELCTRLSEVFRAAELQQAGGAELILVDDGSTDGTWQTINEQQGRYPFVVGKRHPQNLGMPAAWRTGVEAAQGRLVCLLDADMQYQPEDIPRLWRELLSSKKQIIQGWRSPRGRDKGPRYYYSRGLNVLLNLLFGMKLQDNKSDFVLCAREILADLLDYRGKYYYWQLFIMVAAHYKGYSYAEVEVLFANRRFGTSFLADHPIRPTLLSFVDIGRALGEYKIFGR